MIENKKQMVSLRIGAHELNKVRGIAHRLKVRESDVFRFAVKATLARLGMFHDESVVGRDLLPVFMEFGMELASYFELDAAMMERLINKGAAEDQKVDRRDIELFALAGTQDQYVYMRLRELAARHDEAVGLPVLLREYMYDKYLRPSQGGRAAEPATLPATGTE